jgi:NAD(P)-dependent dehydrogenase (short-subunit alcohol dehydrogenase family)
MERGKKAVEDIGGKAVLAAMDVRNPAEIAAAFDKIECEAGPIDVLINNAAGNIIGVMEDLSPNAFKAVVGIVLEGTYFCSRELARRSIASKRPAVIMNVGGQTAWIGGAGQSISAAAKAGVHNLTLSLAVEWAPYGIRVNTLVPGLFPQPDLKVDVIENVVANAGVPAGRFGRLQELTWAATYLCSPFASYITGIILPVDGALSQFRGPQSWETFVPIRDQLGYPAFGEPYDPVEIAMRSLKSH